MNKVELSPTWKEVIAMAQTLNNMADRLTIGDPFVSGRLTICPLFFSGGKEVDEEDASDQKEICYL